MHPLYERLTRHVLLGPGIVRRAAARRVRTREERWMLTQPRHVRHSYVREVLENAGEPRAQEIWMLRQPGPVRESYVREVLEEAG
jgi:hypothetical protein